MYGSWVETVYYGFHAKSAPITAEIAPTVKTPAALATPPLVPRPPVGTEVLLDVKLEIAEFAELITEERELREDESPLGSETGVVDDNNEAGRVLGG